MDKKAKFFERKECLIYGSIEKPQLWKYGKATIMEVWKSLNSGSIERASI